MQGEIARKRFNISLWLNEDIVLAIEKSSSGILMKRFNIILGRSLHPRGVHTAYDIRKMTNKISMQRFNIILACLAASQGSPRCI